MEELYFRFDYLSLFFEAEADQFQLMLGRLEELGQDLVGGKIWQQSVHVAALGAAPGGRRRYAINVYGTAARVVEKLPTSWVQYITRLDIKAYPPDITGEVADKIAWQLFANDNPYNITTYNSRERKKGHRRGAGGKGFAIGSHKSDLRVSMYSRAGSPYCLEYQVSGAMLRRILDGWFQKGIALVDKERTWFNVKEDLRLVGNARWGRALAAAGIGDYRPTNIDERIAAADEAIDQHQSAEAQQAKLDLDDDFPRAEDCADADA